MSMRQCRVIELAPDSGEAHALFAGLLKDRGDMETAIRHYGRALSLGYDPAATAGALGRLHASEGNYADAAEALRRALNEGHADADLYALLGNAEEKQGHRDAARTAYRHALEVQARHPDAQAGLARLRAKPKPRKTASAPTASQFSERGRRHLAEGRLTEAADAFEAAVRRAPGNAGLWNDLGTVYARLEMRDKTRNAFERAMQLAIGGVVSWTVTVAVQLSTLALGSVIVNVTVFDPKLVQSNASSDRE